MLKRVVSKLGKSLSTSSHPVAITSFNSNHELYDQIRPDFDSKMIDPFFKDLSIQHPESQKILELAAGTGKFTKSIVSKGWEKPNQLVVVEPSQGMLDSFQLNFPNIESKLGSSYEIPVSSESIDAVIIAQAFHWFADLNSLKEIHRVLKPGGKLGLIWNFDGVSYNKNLALSDCELPISEQDQVRKTGWEALSVKGSSYDGNVPQYRTANWRKAFETQNLFESPIDKFSYRMKPFDSTKVYEYWLSRSFITSLPPNEKQEFKAELERIISSLPSTNFTDASRRFLYQFLGSEYFVVTKKQ